MATPLYLKHQPLSWSEFEGPDTIAASFAYWISENKHPRFIAIYGLPGTGKTTAARLYIKSTLCLNRRPGEYDPCGHCDICKAEPSELTGLTGVHWVAPQPATGETEYKAAQAAVDAAINQPFGFGEPHRNRRILVFEEAQDLRRDTLQSMLYFGDVAGRFEHLTILVMAMAPERLAGRFPDIKEAIERRGRTITLPSPSPQQVLEYLERLYPDAHLDSLRLIASQATNYGQALTYLEQASEFDKHLSPELTALALQIVPARRRLDLWEKLESQYTRLSDIKDLVENILKNADRRKFMEQMLHDVREAAEDYDEYLFVDRLFAIYEQNWAFFSPVSILSELKGSSLIPKVTKLLSAYEDQ